MDPPQSSFVPCNSRQFKDEELKKEFSMNAAQLKKLRLAAQEGALGVPLESPQQAEDPNLVRQPFKSEYLSSWWCLVTTIVPNSFRLTV